MAVIATALLVCFSSLIELPASASTTVPPTSVGFDISFPQCTSTLPFAPGLAVVGVNNGKNFTVNKCLAKELAWAKTATNGAPAFYVNSGNPGPVNDTAWPTSQSAPKLCHGANSSACSYDYGWNAARASYGAAVRAESTDGSTSGAADAKAANWWLDVETANPWEARVTINGATTLAYTNDQASVLGMAGYLASIGVKSVGIYTATSMWRAIMGLNVTAFSAYSLWIPGPGSLTTAEAQCAVPSFLGGRTGMVQYPSLGLDGDYLCGLLNTPATVSVSLSGSSAVSDQVLVTNNSGPVTFTEATGSPSLVVSTSGLVTTSGPLAVGSYIATGTTVDAEGNTGTFSFTLGVGTLSQSSPLKGSAKVSTSLKYTTQIAVTNPVGAVTFSQTTGTPSLIVSPAGIITTNGALTVGTYSATGTESDTADDVGTFSFTLTVGALVQRAPLTAAVTTDNSSTFTAQLAVGANLGPVTYVQTGGLPRLIVSSTGAVTTYKQLNKGTFKATGTTSDATGDAGAFTFTLTVTQSVAPTTTVPTTTTTLPPPPVALRVIGHAVAGQSKSLVIVGSGFFGRPSITSHKGTIVLVTSDTGNRLYVIAVVRAHSRKGVFSFLLRFSTGQVCKVRYNQT
jgi:hypothetical protein